MDHYIISIDQGTSSTKCVLIRADGQIVRRINLTHRLLHPAAGFAEHDPREIVCGIQGAIRKLAEPLPSGFPLRRSPSAYRRARFCCGMPRAASR